MYESASRLFELLKASGWQTFMLAVAAGLLLYLSANQYLPPMPSAVIVTVWIVLFVCAALAAASIGAALQGLAGRAWAIYQRRRARQSAENQFRKYLPYLSDKERQVLGYLLAKKLKTFTADQDGGYAGTLIARGFIRYIGVAGQTFEMNKCPLAVPDHVWKVMEEQPDQFPYKPEYSPRDRKVEVQPWRIPSGW